MGAASVLLKTGKRQADEHKETKKVIAEFDKAVKDLHASAGRLQIAADHYRERLEGGRVR